MTIDDVSCTLRVVEAMTQDALLGRARLDSQTRTRLGVSAGDIIEIEGQRITLAVVWRSSPSDEGKAIIRLDGVQRSNLLAGRSSKVKVRKATIQVAKSVILGPTRAPPFHVRFDPNIHKIAKRDLLNRPIRNGDTIISPSLRLFGEMQLLKVRRTSPQGNVLITEETDVSWYVPKQTIGLGARP